MKNIIIAGSTGMVGKLVLQECLRRKDVNKVTSITRRSTGIKNKKLIEVIHNDFLDYSGIEKYFRNQDVCFYCIGVYTGQVPADEFIKITVAYTKAFGEALRRNNTSSTFCFLSGQGADSSERSHILFAREKGIAENIILKLKFDNTYIFRPAYIYPDSPRQEPNLFYRIFRVIYKPLSLVLPNIGVSSTKLASKMVDVGLNGGDRTIYNNRQVKE
ncbi:MAG TPA: NAD-dependent epimerase/dehydratase family protein [Spirochaetota bacterium]